MSNNEQARLRAEKAGKRGEMKIIEAQVRLLQNEIQLRKDMIKGLLDVHFKLNDEAQALAERIDEIAIESEHNSTA